MKIRDQFDGGYSVIVWAKCYISNASWGIYQTAEGILKHSISKMYIPTNSTLRATSVKMCLTT